MKVHTEIFTKAKKHFVGDTVDITKDELEQLKDLVAAVLRGESGYITVPVREQDVFVPISSIDSVVVVREDDIRF